MVRKRGTTVRKRRGGTTRHRTGFSRNPEVYCFPLASGCDASALSRFVHHVLDANLSTAESVVIVAAERAAADSCCLAVLDLVIGRLVARRVRAIVVSAASASLQAMDRGTYPNFPLALFVESEGEAAHLILHSARIPR